MQRNYIFSIGTELLNGYRWEYIIQNKLASLVKSGDGKTFESLILSVEAKLRKESQLLR